MKWWILLPQIRPTTSRGASDGLMIRGVVDQRKTQIRTDARHFRLAEGKGIADCGIGDVSSGRKSMVTGRVVNVDEGFL